MNPNLISLLFKLVIFSLLLVGAVIEYRTKEMMRHQIEIQQQHIDTQQRIIQTLESREGKI